MAILKEYTRSSDKEGYYVHAQISGLNHPLPLQTPEVTAEIYRQLGYEPKEPGHNGGVNVPNELTWTLYDVGLHWTENSGPRGAPSDLDPEDIQGATGPSLSDSDKSTILSHIQDYKGQYKEEVNSLIERLEKKTDENRGGENSTTLKEIVESFNDSMTLNVEVKDTLRKWEPGSVVDDDHEFEHELGEVFRTTRSEHYHRLNQIPNLSQTVREFEEHPWEIDSATAYDWSSEGPNLLKIEFSEEPLPDNLQLSVIDFREADQDIDFKIQAVLDERGSEFEIYDGYISDFGVRVNHTWFERLELPEESHWAYQVEELDRNKMVHSLVSDIARLIPIIEKFFDDWDNYNLESTKLGEHSIYWP